MLINKSLKLEKRILSGGKNLDNMRFILGIFTNLYDRFNFLPNLVMSRMHRPNLNRIFIRYIV